MGPVKLECNDPEQYIGGAVEFLQGVKERNLNNNVSPSPHQFG